MEDFISPEPIQYDRLWYDQNDGRTLRDYLPGPTKTFCQKKRINHDNALERECIVREVWQDEGVLRIGNEEIK